MSEYTPAQELALIAAVTYPIDARSYNHSTLFALRGRGAVELMSDHRWVLTDKGWDDGLTLMKSRIWAGLNEGEAGRDWALTLVDGIREYRDLARLAQIDEEDDS